MDAHLATIMLAQKQASSVSVRSAHLASSVRLPPQHPRLAPQAHTRTQREQAHASHAPQAASAHTRTRPQWRAPQATSPRLTPHHVRRQSTAACALAAQTTCSHTHTRIGAWLAQPASSASTGTQSHSLALRAILRSPTLESARFAQLARSAQLSSKRKIVLMVHGRLQAQSRAIQCQLA